MRSVIFLCACALVTACMTSSSGPDEELESRVGDPDEAPTAPIGGAPVLIDARATDDLDRIHAAASSASLTSCHGTTTCPGGLPISSFYTVSCGAPYCSNQGCLKSEFYTVKKQPRESYQAFAMPDGSVCLAYQPATAANAGCTCYTPY